LSLSVVELVETQKGHFNFARKGHFYFGLTLNFPLLTHSSLRHKIPPNYIKNADEDEYASKRFPESQAVRGASKAKAQKPNGPPSCEVKALSGTK
jgi:hypothetical protein